VDETPYIENSVVWYLHEEDSGCQTSVLMHKCLGGKVVTCTQVDFYFIFQATAIPALLPVL